MDRPKPLDDASEDWLWSLPWATAPKDDWTAIIDWLREVARSDRGHDWRNHDCAIWADLLETLKSTPLPATELEWPDDVRPKMKAECH
jgi:hypothetical protein